MNNETLDLVSRADVLAIIEDCHNALGGGADMTINAPGVVGPYLDSIYDEIAALDTKINALAVHPFKLDPNESDPLVLWAAIHNLRHALKGPEGFATWQEAAVHERLKRVEAERKFNQ